MIITLWEQLAVLVIAATHGYCHGVAWNLSIVLKPILIRTLRIATVGIMTLFDAV